MSRGCNVSKFRRARQHAKEWLMWQSNGTAIPRAHFLAPERMTLEVVDLDGHTHLARYEKPRGLKWRLLRCDAVIDFLRFCGPQDAVLALKRRGMTHRWMGVGSKGQMDAQQSAPHRSKDRGMHQSAMPTNKARSTNPLGREACGMTNPRSSGEHPGKSDWPIGGSPIVTDGELKTSAHLPDDAGGRLPPCTGIPVLALSLAPAATTGG